MNAEQTERYSRHIRLPQIGEDGQQKLLNGKVLIVGAGGLGSPVALYLVAAGVGTVGIMDGDAVDLSNLQRQILHGTPDLGVAKTDSARASLERISPDSKIVTYNERLTAANGASIVSEYDFVIDATDNFDSKFLVADLCAQAGKPYSHAGILAFTGQAMTVIPGACACYRCIFEEVPAPQESDRFPAGPIGALPGVIGSIQATEALKYLMGIGELLTNRLLTYDSMNMKFREIPLARNPQCRCASMN
ncbi:ThiF family adenylyltransferase [Verrucomicrobiota bacterium]